MLNMTLICQIKMSFFIIQMMPNFWLMIYLINFFMLIYMIILNYFNFKNKKL